MAFPIAAIAAIISAAGQMSGNNKLSGIGSAMNLATQLKKAVPEDPNNVNPGGVK